MISILYVEDEILLSDAIKDYLSGPDTRIETIESGEKALSMLNSGNYDVIVSDYDMPGMNGIELLKHVRTLYGDIPFVIFTGKSGESAVIEALNAGADYYFLKGGNATLEFNRLLDTLHQVVERRKHESIIHQKNVLFREIFTKNEAIMLLISALDGKIVDANQAAISYYGYSPEDLQNMTIYQINQEKKTIIESRILNALEGGTQEIICNHWLASGEIRNVEVFATPIVMGKQPFLFLIIHDITEKRQAENALRESEERYRNLIEDQTELIIRSNMDGEYIYVNEVFCNFFGVKKEQVLGSKWKPHIFPDDIPKNAQVNQTLSLKHPVTRIEIRTYHHSGELRWLQFVIRGIFDGNGLLEELHSVGRDITEQKRMSEDLRQKTEELNTFFTAVIDLLCIANTEGYFLRLNPAWEQVLGWSMDELMSRTFLDFVHPDDIPPTMEVMSELSRQHEVINFTNRYRCKDGTYRWIEWRSIPVGNRIYAAARDITDRLEVEHALRESESKVREMNERFTLAADAANIGVWELNIQTNTLLWDDRMYRLFQINPSEAHDLNKRWMNALHPEDKADVENDYLKIMDNNQDLNIEYRILWPNGEVRYQKSSAKIIRDSDGSPIRMTGINYDFTERKKIERELLEYATKLENMYIELDILTHELKQLNLDLDKKVQERTQEVSRLLTMKSELITQIGHDLKTPLTSIFALLPHVKKRTSDPALIKLLDVVLVDAHRMQNIISTILDLSSQEIRTFEDMAGEVNLNETMINAIQHEHMRIHYNDLQVINSLSENIVVKMAPAHLNAICLNLISNAAKYSKPGGTITISSERRDMDYVLIVADDGIGISEEDLPRIFDEFYRADPSRHDRDSHGLGLALTNRIVHAYGGKITAFSKGAGLGTRFEVTIPEKRIVSGK